MTRDDLNIPLRTNTVRRNPDMQTNRGLTSTTDEIMTVGGTQGTPGTEQVQHTRTEDSCMGGTNEECVLGGGGEYGE